MCSNQIISSNAQEDIPDHPHSVSQPILEQVPPSEGNASSAESKDDQLNQEILSLPEVPRNPNIQNGPNYNLGLVSTILGNQFVQFEGPETQTQEASRFSNFVVSFKLCFSIMSIHVYSYFMPICLFLITVWYPSIFILICYNSTAFQIHFLLVLLILLKLLIICTQSASDNWVFLLIVVVHAFLMLWFYKLVICIHV